MFAVHFPTRFTPNGFRKNWRMHQKTTYAFRAIAKFPYHRFIFLLRRLLRVSQLKHENAHNFIITLFEHKAPLQIASKLELKMLYIIV